MHQTTLTNPSHAGASRDVVQAQAEDCVIAACGEDVANNEVLPAVDAACSAL